MNPLDRRRVLAGLGATPLAGCATFPGSGRPESIVWRFGDLASIGAPLTIEGAPRPVAGPASLPGGALLFDGVDDALFIGQHPLAGAATFAFEAVFRPDGGATEQRWLHLQADEDAVPGQAPVGTRFLFEIRVYGDEWALDAFVKGPTYNQTLVFPDRRHPVGRWHHVAQTYDGTTYRSFVNGELQGEAVVAFTPQGPGRASVGTRINRVSYFNGAIAEARFTRRFLRPDQFTGGNPA
ncbi:LamG domain-containing protein [Brevundimonas sp. AJA228-03]|uniref:LamG domain-containing protein n=1 Tax=Brevundimonas sp. AJA228-03 TaxID=2752515 RepID=UPI001FD847AB|nr:LamG domain-containing protein [Brevundimonas sp. AJA228-03]